MINKRSSGILLHPTSLPGPDGIGDLGPQAYIWVDFLAESGIKNWQILPLGPTGFGDSPYQSFSAFAGNTNLISLELLKRNDLISTSDLRDRPSFSEEKVNYNLVKEWKDSIFKVAFTNFSLTKNSHLADKYERFLEINQKWINDYALYLALKEDHGLIGWNEWKSEYKCKEESSLDYFSLNNKKEIQYHSFLQFLFHDQWQSLRKYANDRNISIIGDIPIFVAMDSCDTWKYTELFFIDEHFQPIFVAGVPPDYFSNTGQLWGNPLFRWDKHHDTGYSWWIERIRKTLELVDIVRIDHFRGFAGYWEIPAGMQTAEIGQWKIGPGEDFFDSVMGALGYLPIIAEDLGEITPDVISLRDKYSFPGMKILQFAFSNGLEDPFLPQNYPINCVAYTGTHDNDTTLGWFKQAPENEKAFCINYLNTNEENIQHDMIRAIWSSEAILSIAPLQDFMRLETDARMNYPGTTEGNWQWRYKPQQLNNELKDFVSNINKQYNR